MSTRARLHSRLRWVVVAAAAVPTLLATPWAYVRVVTASSIRETGGSVEHADAALVLGARVYKDGRPSRFLRERVEAGVELYRAGAVDRIIMSGDGEDSSGFGEPSVMRRVAERMGVPPASIVEDPLGVDTYSSCVRARDVYSVRSVIVTTQRFHMPRAVWLCQRAGLEARGTHPPARLTKSTVWGNIREIAAVGKAVGDVMRARVPRG